MRLMFRHVRTSVQLGPGSNFCQNNDKRALSGVDNRKGPWVQFHIGSEGKQLQLVEVVHGTRTYAPSCIGRAQALRLQTIWKMFEPV